MKKVISLILTLILCVGLVIPAAAAEASPFTVETSLDGYENNVQEKCSMNYSILTEKPFTLDDYKLYSEDTTITWTNNGADKDFVYIDIWAYEETNPGEYAICAAVLSAQVLTGGQSCTTSVSELLANFPDEKEGEPGYFDREKALYVLAVKVVYGDIFLPFLSAFKVDNDAVAEIVAKGKPQADDPGNPFTDVPKNAYYHDAVLWALEQNITTGKTKTTFGPTDTCTRGQVATFLWRAKGCPEPKTSENPFTDVKESDYFYKAVLWAFENGITTGTTDTTFSPNGICTSAHVVTFLWRANGKPAAEHTGTEYYAEAVAWAEANALLSGTATPFAPHNLSPRADIVTYLYRDMGQ